MKRPLVAPLFALLLGVASIDSARSEPQLVIGKTVATPRTITVCAQNSSTANGQLLRDTLAGITDATSAKPYVVHLEPGYYAMGGTGLSMKPWVTIVGSGQGNTRITGTTGNASTGVVIAASSCGLRDVAVLNPNNTGAYAVGIYASAVVDFRLTRVAISANGGSSGNRGLYLYNAPVEVTDCSIEVRGHSTAGGLSHALYNNHSNSLLRDTTLSAQATGPGKCRGVYNWASSPTFHHVVIEARWQGEEEDGEACGMRNDSGSNPVLNDVTVSATADSDHTDIRAAGMDNYNASSPTVTGGMIYAYTKGATAVGIRSRKGSSPWLHSTVVKAESFGGSTFAVFTTHEAGDTTPGKITINSSSLVAFVTGAITSQYALWNDANYTANLGSTLLDGSVFAGGSENCQACYDGDYNALNDTCL